VNASILSPGQRRTLIATIAIAAGVCFIGAFAAPERTWANILLGAMYLVGLSLGALLFLVFGYVTHAGWNVAFRRVPEALAGTLPVGALFVLLSLAGLPLLYEWSHAGAMEHDALLASKSWWLEPSAFVLRSIAYLVIWLLFARLIIKGSRATDAAAAGRALSRNVVLSAVFLVVFAATFSLATFDWLMSLEPHWFSTVFAVYNFSGVVLSGLAAITLACVALRRAGPLRGIFRDDHLHDLGKLTIGFSTFWAYIWFCQYMLIWYGNIPEETAYYVLREQGAWAPLTFFNPIVNWLVPFLILLPRATKRDEGWMVKVAVLLLVGRWFDLYTMILPSRTPEGPVLGLVEIAMPVMATAIAILAFSRAWGRASVVPTHDPLLVESVHHHT